MQHQLTVPRDVKAAKYLALIGGEVGAMIGEFKLAQMTGMPTWAAWSLPLLLSLYAYAAFRMGRSKDVAIALGLVATSQGAAHLISAAVVNVDWRLIIAVWSVLLPVALWRLHQVAKDRVVVEPDEPAPAEDDTEEISIPLPQPTQKRWKLTDAIAEVWRLEQAEPPLKDEEIGQRMGISRVRVGQIRRAAVEKRMVPEGANWGTEAPVTA